MTKSLIKVAIGIALASGFPVAWAQSGAPSDSTARAKAFIDEFRVLQSYSGTGPTWQLNKPTPSTRADDPSPGLTVSEMQAASSESPTFHPENATPSAVAAASADPVPPHGLSIAQYQALSSESQTYQLPNQADSTAMAASATTNGGQALSKRPLSQRIAAFFHHHDNGEHSAN